MKHTKEKYYGFTLIELIVVVTILAILGTLAFISLSNYGVYAKNGKRISDMRTIERALNLSGEIDVSYPLPDNAVAINYSGATLWYQGTFGPEAQKMARRITSIPKDPEYNVEYSYSVSANKKIFQLASIQKGGLFGYENMLISSANAYGAKSLTSQALGSYFGFDVVGKIGNLYNILAVPSIMLSDIPPGNTLQNNQSYNFVYDNSPHLPPSYSGALDSIENPLGFQTRLVYSGSTIETLEDLELYIAKLSTSYQSLFQDKRFETLIFSSNTPAFKKTMIQSLESQGVLVSSGVKNQVENPPLVRQVGDTFSGVNGQDIIGSYDPDIGNGKWKILGAGATNSYLIEGGALEKIDASPTLFSFEPIPFYLNADYLVSFDVLDFSSGKISIFLRYTDADNYYILNIRDTGYELIKVEAGSTLVLQNINEAITPGSNIHFEVIGDAIIVQINGIEKENIVLPGLTDIGDNAIFLENIGARIDNFLLYYR